VAAYGFRLNGSAAVHVRVISRKSLKRVGCQRIAKPMNRLFGFIVVVAELAYAA